MNEKEWYNRTMKMILRTHTWPISLSWADGNAYSFQDQNSLPWSIYRIVDGDGDNRGSKCFEIKWEISMAWSDNHSAFDNANIDYWEKEDKKQFDELTDKIDFKF